MFGAVLKGVRNEIRAVREVLYSTRENDPFRSVVAGPLLELSEA